MTSLVNHIFNADKTDYENPSIFLGQDKGLLDTINKKFPTVWKLYKSMKSLDWDENEFDYKKCEVEFATCPRNIYDMMIKTLAWQWEADSAAAQSIAPIIAMYSPATEVWVAWQRISDNESIHALTYSEIVRNSFVDPDKAMATVLEEKKALERLSTVAHIMGNAKIVGHKIGLGMIDKDSDEAYDAVFMFVAALLILERIQFMASFSITFAICDLGYFNPIGKAVQKIAQDELEVHVAMDKEVLRHEMSTARGAAAFERCRPLIQKTIDEVLFGEYGWTDYMFSDGRELPGMNAQKVKDWVGFNALDVYSFFGLTPPAVPKTLPNQLPLKFMERWLNIGKMQPSPQEEDVAMYRLGIMQRDDEDANFDEFDL